MTSLMGERQPLLAQTRQDAERALGRSLSIPNMPEDQVRGYDDGDDTDDNGDEGAAMVERSKAGTVLGEKADEVKVKLRKLVRTPEWHWAIIALIIVDGCCDLISLIWFTSHACTKGVPTEEPWWIETFATVSLVITTFFLFEIPINIVAHGLKYYSHHLLNMLDLIVVVTTFILEVVLHGEEKGFAGLIVFLRLWRILKVVEGSVQAAAEVGEERARELKRQLHEEKNLRLRIQAQLRDETELNDVVSVLSKELETQKERVKQAEDRLKAAGIPVPWDTAKDDLEAVQTGKSVEQAAKEASRHPEIHLEDGQDHVTSVENAGAPVTQLGLSEKSADTQTSEENADSPVTHAGQHPASERNVEDAQVETAEVTQDETVEHAKTGAEVAQEGTAEQAQVETAKVTQEGTAEVAQEETAEHAQAGAEVAQEETAEHAQVDTAEHAKADVEVAQEETAEHVQVKAADVAQEETAEHAQVETAEVAQETAEHVQVETAKVTQEGTAEVAQEETAELAQVEAAEVTQDETVEHAKTGAEVAQEGTAEQAQVETAKVTQEGTAEVAQEETAELAQVEAAEVTQDETAEHAKAGAEVAEEEPAERAQGHAEDAQADAEVAQEGTAEHVHGHAEDAQAEAADVQAEAADAQADADAAVTHPGDHPTTDPAADAS